MTTLSIWPKRLLNAIEALCDNLAQQPSDPSLDRAEVTHWELWRLGKYIESTGNLGTAAGEPWSLSLAVYAAVGRYEHDEGFSPKTLNNLRAYLGPVRNAGWSITDILQAVEFCKDEMRFYPTDERWSDVLKCSVAEVTEARKNLKPTFVECFTSTEQSLWKVGLDLDISVSAWVDVVDNHVDAAESFELKT